MPTSFQRLSARRSTSRLHHGRVAGLLALPPAARRNGQTIEIVAPAAGR